MRVRRYASGIQSFGSMRSSASMRAWNRASSSASAARSPRPARSGSSESRPWVYIGGCRLSSYCRTEAAGAHAPAPLDARLTFSTTASACPSARLARSRGAGEPCTALPVEFLHFRPGETRKAGALHGITDPRLQICEMPVALRKARKQRRIELRGGAGSHRIDSVLFVDRLAADPPPPPRPALEEVIESSGAHHIAEHTLDGRALTDRHLRLRDGALVHDVARE